MLCRMRSTEVASICVRKGKRWVAESKDERAKTGGELDGGKTGRGGVCGETGEEMEEREKECSDR
jgi:hypothetical protein